MVAECGAPTYLMSDIAPEFKGTKQWTSYLESLCIKAAYTEVHQPNQNLAERQRGGALKVATVHLLMVTGAPFGYWCFALEKISCWSGLFLLEGV